MTVASGHTAAMTVTGANGRHRHMFAYERLLLFIAANSTPRHSVRMTKRQLAQAVGCSTVVADRGIHYLEARRLLKRRATHGPDGSQKGNSYSCTPKGTLVANMLRERITCQPEAEKDGRKGEEC